jgi:hypothetical protein
LLAESAICVQIHAGAMPLGELKTTFKNGDNVKKSFYHL